MTPKHKKAAKLDSTVESEFRSSPNLRYRSRSKLLNSRQKLDSNSEFYSRDCEESFGVAEGYQQKILGRAQNQDEYGLYECNYDDDFDEYDNDYYEFYANNVYRIPLVLLVLTVISILFVGILGKNHSYYKLSNKITGNEKGIQYYINSNRDSTLNLTVSHAIGVDLDSYYKSILTNISEEQIDKVRIEDLQMAFQLLIRGLDERFEKIERKMALLESDFTLKAEQNKNLTQTLQSQFDYFERETSHKADYLEKLVSELKIN
ncbi:hypothetical protein FG386_001027 [Cryptosporidium ryanae]|uniref:uncharacterized protein n=1 Tax=Cryptosporidium ryanae TaxID=515981 RepID=UPI00351A1E2E|nr:hypothetical protein FG386_001027 [Cryptosporidium ryanae]